MTSTPEPHSSAVNGARTSTPSRSSPYVRRLAEPEPLVYSVAEAAHVLSTSTNAMRRVIEQGVLPVVPHMGHRVVIPRSAVVRLVESATAEAAWERQRPLSVAR